MNPTGLFVALLAAQATTVVTGAHAALKTPLDRKPMVTRRRLSLNGRISGFSLIDADTSTKVMDLVNGTIIDLSNFVGTPPLFNINASYITGNSDDNDIGSVQFGHNADSHVHTENYAWYSFCGNRGPNFFDCATLSEIGNHTVTATPFAGRFAEGEAGVPYTVTFTVIMSSSSPSSLGQNVTSPVVSTLSPNVPPVPATPTVAKVGKPKVPVASIERPRPLPLPPLPSDVVFAPQLLDLVVSSSIVNITSGLDTASIQVVFAPDKFGISEVSLQAYTSEQEASGSCTMPTTSNDGINAACNCTLTFAPFIAEGNYSLRLFVYSGNFYYSKEFMVPHEIEVYNANQDTTPPILLGFDLFPPTTLNITAEDATLTIQIALLDNLSGVSAGYLYVIDPDGFTTRMSGYFDATGINFQNSSSYESESFLVNVSITFGNHNRPGDYSLRLLIYDNAGNNELYETSALQDKGFVSSIKVVNANYDGDPPELLSFVILPSTTANATLAAATVEMQLLVEDAMSGVSFVYVQVIQSSENVYNSLSASFGVDNAGAGTLPANLSLIIPRFTRSGEYNIELQITDARGNTASFNADQLANQSYPYFIDVVNNLEDVTPPKLLSLVALTPTTVNASSEQNTITLQLVVQDDVSGLLEAYVSGYGEGRDPSNVYDAKYIGKQESPINDMPVTFNFSLSVGQSTKPGKYSLEVTLYDNANNYAYYDSANLAAMNMSYSIEVVNPAYDGTPPVLEYLVVLSSSTVNVTLASAMLEVQIVVNDDVSGLKNGIVELWA